jgi:hypothetical protein
LSSTALLLPFERPQGLTGLRLAVGVERLQAELQLTYQLQGPLDQLLLPSVSNQPERRDLLWQHSCLELFLSTPEDAGYWELNVAATGDWAIYRLEGYRQGLQAADEYSELPIRQQRRADNWKVQCKLRLPAAIGANSPLMLGVTAVLEQSDGTLSYWALAHPGEQPDFHHRDSFQLAA